VGILVVRSRDKLDELAGIHPNSKILRGAPAAIVICALPEAQSSLCSGSFPQDCGAAAENILLQAVGLGLGSCWCGVWPTRERINKVRDVLGIPNNQIPFNIVALGIPDEQPAARGYLERERIHYAD